MVEELARSGVRHATISPGSRSTPVALALHRHPAIEAVVILDERSAGFFALGAGQATGAPSVVACTSGSAAANLHPAVVEADEAGVPLLVLSSDRPPELRGIGAGQTIDQLKLYGSSVRWFCELGTHEADDSGLLHYRATACRAFAAASGDPRPGPVHLNLAWRDPLGPQERPEDVTATTDLALHGRGELPLTAVAYTPPAPEPALLEELAGVEPASRAARFVCVAALATPSGDIVTRRGECRGRLLLQPRGEDGFGYDPIFAVAGSDRTMAELPADEKNQMSHRARAFKALAAAIAGC